MVDDTTDDVLDARMQRVVRTLRELPTVDGLATARLLIAVAGLREQDREAGAVRGKRDRLVARTLQYAAGAAALAAAAVMGALWVPTRTAPDRITGVARVNAAPDLVAPTATDSRARLAAGAKDAIVLVPVPLVFKAPTAMRVQVAGDFNGWSPSAAPMTRDEATGLWSTTLSLRAGRHVYAFVVNDSEWVRDPRAQAAPDADFGRPGSVMLVGHP